MKRTLLGAFLAGFLVVFFLSACNYNSYVRNRGQKRETVFDGLPMKYTFLRAASPDEKRAVEAMQRIQKTLRMGRYTPAELTANFRRLLRSPTLTKKAKLYTYFLLKRYPVPDTDVLGVIQQDFHTPERATVSTLTGELKKGAIEEWALRAFNRALKPELKNIYGSGITLDDLHNMEIPPREQRKKLRNWLPEHAEYLVWSRSKNGFVVDRRRKQWERRREQEMAEKEREEMQREREREAKR